MNKFIQAALLHIILLAAVTAHAGGPFNKKPKYIKGDISAIQYDGSADDLLTGGLGKSGLQASSAPGFVDAENPTNAELRTLAIYNNYRALVPTDLGNGYGVFFGPNVTADGTATGSEGTLAGTEYLAYADRGRSGKKNVTLMVQVPDSFDPSRPCIVTAPSSGSRGIYGAIGTAGEWGLKNDCAVAYTDKGTGTGAHNLQDDTVGTITGQRQDADVAGKQSHFTAKMSHSRQAAFNADTPDRWAFKHAHSQRNPEKSWDKNVLQSIEFAFYVLNEEFGEPGPGKKTRKSIVPENTIVIASSVSNGGGASVRAAEQDKKEWIDGVAVSEPNVNPKYRNFGIKQGADDPLFDHSRNLYDYTSFLNVFQGCASAAPANATAPINLVPSPNACTSLAAKGLLSGGTLDAQANEAQQIINDYGFIPEQNVVQPSHWFLNVPQGIAVTYANTYGRLSVLKNLCGYSFGATDGTSGDPVPLLSTVEKALFGTSNGIPPTSGINLVNNDSLGGAKENRASISPSTGSADQNVDGALCLRFLATGTDIVTGRKLSGKPRSRSRKIKSGIKSILAAGHLRGLPAIIVTGRNDAILPINHTSRAYYGSNQIVEGAQSNLRYYEITNAHHLDVLNQFPTFDQMFIPLHYYLFEALDIMLDHLRNGTALPPSQVVHTVPRGTGAPPLAEANVPDIASAPEADEITFSGNILSIPD